MATVLRGIVGLLALVAGLLIVSGCAPAAEQPPAAQPSQAPAAKPVAGPEWKVTWDKTLAAAKQEGKVVVSGAMGESFREASMEFEKAFPEIKLEYSGTRTSEKMAKIKAEREGGQYLWDVYGGGWTTVAGGFEEFLTPIRTSFILPEVLDDSKWLSGFNAGLIDDYTFAFFAYMFHGAYVNRDFFPESELKKIDDLLDPKWKGKIAWADPLVPGAGRSVAAHLLAERGEDWYRKLMGQDVMQAKDTRMLAEDIVRGRYAVGFGIRAEDISVLTEAGLWKSVKPLDGASYITAGSGHVAIFDKAPNPNAAKVFLNWLVSKEGQDAHVKMVNVNSRRLDAIDGPADTAVPPGYEFTDNQFIEWPYNDQVLEITKQILR